MTVTIEQLEENKKKAMNDVQDMISLFYDEAYTDDECLTFIREALVAARRARNVYFDRIEQETLE